MVARAEVERAARRVARVAAEWAAHGHSPGSNADRSHRRVVLDACGRLATALASFDEAPTPPKVEVIVHPGPPDPVPADGGWVGASS